MGKNIQKELKKRFYGQNSFIAAFILSALFVWSGMFLKGIYYLSVINLIIIIFAIIISWWSYCNRVSATAYLFAETFRCFMLLTIWLPIQFTYSTPNNNIWIFGSIIALIIELLVVYVIENKNWSKRIRDWEQTKKIDLQKGTLDILVSSRNYSSESNFLYVSAFIVPILAGIISRVSDVGGNTEVIYLKVISLIGLMLFGIIFSQELLILFKVYQLEKKHNIIFKTEYRNLSGY